MTEKHWNWVAWVLIALFAIFAAASDPDFIACLMLFGYLAAVVWLVRKFRQWGSEGRG